MFLGLLNNQKKELFLKLAYKLAQIDGNYSYEENLVIQGYCQEMQIEFRQDMEQELDEIISELSSACEIKEKRIIVFEVIGLALSDGKYGSAEKEVVVELLDKFEISHDYARKCEDEINKYIAFQNGLNKLVIG